VSAPSTGQVPTGPRATVAVCRSVSREYVVPRRHGPASTVLALDGVDLVVAAGTFVALAGPSGSGKSTLLALLGALDRPTSGTVTVDGVDLSALGRGARRRVRRATAVSMLPQPGDNLLLDRTGRENLSLVARRRARASAGTPADLEDQIDLLVERLGIASFVDRHAREMSGGEQQRLALVAALIGEPPLVLADEPTGALDRANGEAVVAALAAAVSHGATVIAATHDPGVVAAADVVVRLEHGRRVA
jgi:ABC-type lipoprotein export system ATPase subunit